MQQKLSSNFDFVDKPIKTTQKAGVAKKVILASLSKIQKGRIQLIGADGESYSFGDVNSELSTKIRIVDERVYRHVLFRGTIGAGESYMYGWWQIDNLTSLIEIMLLNRSRLNNMDSFWSSMAKSLMHIKDLLTFNTLRGAKRNISYHYDLSNDFFQLFLDKHMQYSSAVMEQGMALEDGSARKIDVIAESLQLSADDHLLEIGTGWGGLAVRVAKTTGCKVTTTTISNEQYEFAKQWVKQEGLEGQVEVLNSDYRKLTGSFDKIVSVEMIEAIGHRNYKVFYSQCDRLLKPGGRALVQAITTTDKRFDREKNKTDFIRRYIFPGGCLPSNYALNDAAKRASSLNLIAMRDLTQDYALTLKAWYQRFSDKLDEVKEMGFDNEFIRMWEFYLCYCEGAFKQRVIHTSHFVYEKP